jgi:hypothetical protein
LTETARGLDVNEDVQGNFTFEKFDVENRSYQSYQNYGPIPRSEVLKYNNLQQNNEWK